MICLMWIEDKITFSKLFFEIKVHNRLVKMIRCLKFLFLTGNLSHFYNYYYYY